MRIFQCRVANKTIGREDGSEENVRISGDDDGFADACL